MNTLIELGVAVCLVGWLSSYALMIRQAHVDRAPAMPLLPLCLNLAWELVFGFVLPDPIEAAAWTNRAWFLVDCVLLWQFLRFGRAETAWLVPPRWFVPVVLASIAASIAGIYTITIDTSDWGGSYTGWGDQVVNSISFLVLLRRRKSSRGQSLYIVLLRSFGSLVLIPAQMQLTPGSLFIPFTCVVWIACDAVYAVLLHRQCRAEGRDPWRLFDRRPATAAIDALPA